MLDNSANSSSSDTSTGSLHTSACISPPPVSALQAYSTTNSAVMSLPGLASAGETAGSTSMSSVPTSIAHLDGRELHVSASTLDVSGPLLVFFASAVVLVAAFFAGIARPSSGPRQRLCVSAYWNIADDLRRLLCMPSALFTTGRALLLCAARAFIIRETRLARLDKLDSSRRGHCVLESLQRLNADFLPLTRRGLYLSASRSLSTAALDHLFTLLCDDRGLALEVLNIYSLDFCIAFVFVDRDGAEVRRPLCACVGRPCAVVTLQLERDARHQDSVGHSSFAAFTTDPSSLNRFGSTYVSRTAAVACVSARLAAAVSFGAPVYGMPCAHQKGAARRKALAANSAYVLMQENLNENAASLQLLIAAAAGLAAGEPLLPGILATIAETTETLARLRAAATSAALVVQGRPSRRAVKKQERRHLALKARCDRAALKIRLLGMPVRLVHAPEGANALVNAAAACLSQRRGGKSTDLDAFAIAMKDWLGVAAAAAEATGPPERAAALKVLATTGGLVGIAARHAHFALDTFADALYYRFNASVRYVTSPADGYSAAIDMVDGKLHTKDGRFKIFIFVDCAGYGSGLQRCGSGEPGSDGRARGPGSGARRATVALPPRAQVGTLPVGRYETFYSGGTYGIPHGGVREDSTGRMFVRLRRVSNELYAMRARDAVPLHRVATARRVFEVQRLLDTADAAAAAAAAAPPGSEPFAVSPLPFEEELREEHDRLCAEAADDGRAPPRPMPKDFGDPPSPMDTAANVHAGRHTSSTMSLVHFNPRLTPDQVRLAHSPRSRP